MSQTEMTFSPIPTGADRRAIEAYVERLASRLDLWPGGALEPSVSRLGGRIVERGGVLDRHHRDVSLKARSLRDFTIFLPETTTSSRNRLIIAHELGHLLLHLHMVHLQYPGATMATRWHYYQEDPCQKQADFEATWFATALLMPKSIFEKIWLNQNGDRISVARFFGVSEQSVRLRAGSFSCLQPNLEAQRHEADMRVSP